MPLAINASSCRIRRSATNAAGVILAKPDAAAALAAGDLAKQPQYQLLRQILLDLFRAGPL